MSVAHAGGEDAGARLNALRVGVLQGTIIATTLAWSFHLVSFLDAKEGVLWGGAVLLGLMNALAGEDCRGAFRALAPCWIVLGGAVILGLAVAPVPAFVLSEGLRLAPILLLATQSHDLLQHPVYRVRVIRAMVLAAAAAALLALLQLMNVLATVFPRFEHYDQEMYSVFGNEGLLAGFLALGLVLLPGCFTTRGGAGRFTCLGLGGLLAVAFFQADSRGGLVSALTGFVALILFRVVSPRRAAAILTGVVALGLALHLTLGLEPWARWLGLFGPEDTGGNLRRWVVRASLELAGHQPLLGCGLGNYVYAVPRWLGAAAPAGGVGANTLTTNHAHLDLLEWYCETGLIGLIGMLWIFSRVRVRHPVALCGLVVVVVFSMTHPAFYSAPHALAACVLFAMNVPGRIRSPEVPRATWRSWASSPIPACAGAAFFLATVLYPSYLLRRAEDLHLSGNPAREDYERATDAWGFHPEAHESFGIWAYEQGDFATARVQFIQARKGLDTGRIHQLQAMTASKLWDGDGACHAYRACAERWPWVKAVQTAIASYCGDESTLSGTGSVGFMGSRL